MILRHFLSSIEILEFDWNSRIRLKSIEIIVDILCFSDVLICLEHFEKVFRCSIEIFFDRRLESLLMREKILPERTVLFY